ncbi:MAG TPA: hypothetical protein VFE11_02940, partial [Dongiaceae bacterium]|nr:hypothetical protein [Dongiaceae bacterium]
LMLDADLAVSIVNHVAEHSHDHGKPLFVSIGSPFAGMRGWIQSHEENIATCLSGRLGVLCTMLEQLGLAPADLAALRDFVDRGATGVAFDVNAVCKLLKTRHVVSCNVRESRGFALLAADDEPYSCFLEMPDEMRTRVQHGNSAGVVDGALAGFIETYLRLAMRRKAESGSIVSQGTRRPFNSNIIDFVEHVSQSEGATPGSVISFEEEARQQSRWAKLWRLTRIAFDVLPVFKYLLSVAAAIIALWVIDVGLDVLAYFGYRVELPDKSWGRMLLRR